jgi:hypothetical protein
MLAIPFQDLLNGYKPMIGCGKSHTELISQFITAGSLRGVRAFLELETKLPPLKS